MVVSFTMCALLFGFFAGYFSTKKELTLRVRLAFIVLVVLLFAGAASLTQYAQHYRYGYGGYYNRY
jgi:uncharacterized membrane protein